MWAVKNQTPYQAAGCWGRVQDGTHEWIVAVKATYRIGPDGALALADEQLPVLIAPEHHGEPGGSSLRYDADLVSAKPTTDILLNATAHAPGGRPSTAFQVGMAVGPVRKVIEVHGDRHWTHGLLGWTPSAPTAIERIPIVYERAHGGYDHEGPDPTQHRMDARNPVGCGLPPLEPGHEGRPLPNFGPGQGAIDQAGPAGFGALDSHWSPRRELAGTYDEAWRRGRMPLLPEDWKAESLQCAPADQRPATHLRGGEPVQLINLTPGGMLRFALPRVHLVFNTLHDGRAHEHRARLGTVVIEPDHARLIMVWQSHLPCPGDIDYLEDTVVREKALL